MSRHPQNGPTFSKSTLKRQKPMTDDERAAWLARKDAELTETKRIVANSRRLHKILHADPKAFLRRTWFIEKGLDGREFWP